MKDAVLPKIRHPERVMPYVAALPQRSDDAIAVFDADGTLWVNDVADDFTSWMIASGAIGGELWERYLRIYRDDPPTGCRFLLQLYRGLTLAALRAKVNAYWGEHAARAWIPEVIETLVALQARGYPIWVVSGTPTEFLLPLEGLLGIDRIVGMDFELDAGAITGQHAGIACAGEGKAEKLRSLLGERPVRFCAGNGSLDGPMMALAEHAWSVYPNAAFAEYSRQQGWAILPRPADFVEEAKFLLED